ncbi:TetR/AcrR family transcriptional regulator [Corynebacterium vitaeruminis]|uniref:TetR family transcriptional regulator n=1 Tax=Corynebacterium vitaeruminis DSM 20294 TaxID=1224164 RepID=W5XZ54_9CORY|nr:TetR/AcrR family transcriptional regulator [Corynebacterium vitaeruminis]AHI22237.1 TetR family transcriptional regulator [Corynebacterium vitaeruminis DSM 20294]
MGLRKDAEENRQRLLQAGKEIFAERGLGATLNDVAKHAGVGVGTAYRRFANKQELFDAILDDQVDEVETILRDAIAIPDADEALRHYLEENLKLQVRDKAMAQMFAGKYASQAFLDASRDRVAPLVNDLAQKAVDVGAVPPHVVGTDLIFIQVGILAIAEITEPEYPGLYTRYAEMALAGLKAASPAHGPIDTEQTHRLMRGLKE